MSVPIKEGRGRIRRSMLGGGGVSLDYATLGGVVPLNLSFQHSFFFFKVPTH